MLKAASFTSRG